MVAKGEDDVLLCGWRVRSPVPLAPDLRRWEGDGRAPDVTITLAPVGDADPRSDQSPFLQVDDSGACRLEVAAVGRLLIRAGSRIIIDPRLPPASAAMRGLLLGPGLGLLAHQRGLFPLQAAAIAIKGGVLAVAGPSGCGKSTLAAVMAGRGHPLVADETCVIDCRAAAGPLVLPSFPRLKLWRQAIEAFGLAVDALEANRVGQQKYHLPLDGPADFAADPLPLSAIVLPNPPHRPEPDGLRRLSLEDAATALAGLIHRRRAAARLGRDRAMAEDVATLAARVPVFRLGRAGGFERLPDQAERLEGLEVP